MTRPQISKLIGAGTIASIMLILFLAFGSFNSRFANASPGENGVFSTVLSSFGEGEDDEDEMGEENETEEEEGEMGEEDEMEEDDDEEDDD